VPSRGEIHFSLTYPLHSKSHLVNVVGLPQGHS